MYVSAEVRAGYGTRWHRSAIGQATSCLAALLACMLTLADLADHIHPIIIYPALFAVLLAGWLAYALGLHSPQSGLHPGTGDLAQGPATSVLDKLSAHHPNSPTPTRYNHCRNVT